MTTTRSRRIGSSAAALVASFALMLTFAGPADALGTRTANRPCGQNVIGSYNDYSGSTSGAAYTERLSGSCAGRLSAEWHSGTSSGGRSYGNSEKAVSTRYGHIISNGYHWGCDACGVSVT